MTETANITITRRKRVGLITLNRPDKLNALSLEMMKDVVNAATELDRDTEIGAIILTGSPGAFAAGADINEMSSKTFMDMYLADWFQGWDALAAVRTPILAAVDGYALGGGCELAMICDFILASESAKFGQPEIKLGVIPGMGGSQRLTLAVGKAKAMEMILTGRTIGSAEAERIGLVARVVPGDGLVEDAWQTATAIAEMSKPIAMLAKEAVNTAFQTSLDSGLLFERRIFHAAFATEDQTEGMRAFMDKRAPIFVHK